MYNRLSFPQFHFRETSLGWSSRRQSSEWHPLYIDRKCDVFKNGHSPAFSSGYYDNGNGLGHVPHDGLGRVYNDNDMEIMVVQGWNGAVFLHLDSDRYHKLTYFTLFFVFQLAFKSTWVLHISFPIHVILTFSNAMLGN